MEAFYLEVHLDLVGGLAGDMFIAALLDAFPHFESQVIQGIRNVSGAYTIDCSVQVHKDHVLQGRRFQVERSAASVARPPFASPDLAAHTTWRSIRARLSTATLTPGARTHAIQIFQLLAAAEAFVHGVHPETVEFHEVGAWDSIADIVGAAVLIDVIGATRWTSSPAPLGSGLVKTAHGMLAVPAPATTRLLLGMPTVDDGIGGERVTPTGAAILRYLCPPVECAREGRTKNFSATVRTLTASGTGFGTRTLRGVSNHLRVLCFDPSGHASGGRREIHVLEFEVDDQSGEDLAVGLDRLRAHPAVLDVIQAPVFGKKGRMMVHVRVLVRYSHLDEVADACFRETTTIGLRHHTVHGTGLKRRLEDVTVDGHRVRVKIVERPGGATAKAESDDLSAHEVHSRRASLRTRAESVVLQDERERLDA